MAELDRLLELMHPEYWDGHELGNGQNTKPVANAHRPIFNYGEVAGPLTVYLETMRSYVSKLRLDGAGIFEPDDYSPGSLVLFDRETLQGSPDVRLSVLDFSDVTCPARPTVLRPQLDSHSSESVYLRDLCSGISYTKMLHWAIIVATKDGRHGLVSTPAEHVHKTRRGKVRLGVFTSELVPIHVGITHHSQANDLSRVNILEVCLPMSE